MCWPLWPSRRWISSTVPHYRENICRDNRSSVTKVVYLHHIFFKNNLKKPFGVVWWVNFPCTVSPWSFCWGIIWVPFTVSFITLENSLIWLTSTANTLSSFTSCTRVGKHHPWRASKQWQDWSDMLHSIGIHVLIKSINTY